MRKLISFITITVILLLGVSVTPGAASSPPLDVKIVAPTIFQNGGPSIGTFVATGPAVDNGLICPKGKTIDVGAFASGWQSGQGVNYHVLKEFTCDDGTGTFVMKLEVRVDFRGDNANWMVFSGTGDYVKLHGTGKLIGIYFMGGSGVLDTYTGKVHSD